MAKKAKNPQLIVEAGLDATGVDKGAAHVEQRVKDMSTSIKKSGQEAASGMDAVVASTEKLTQTQSRFVESVKRNATIASEGKTAYLEQKAAILGVSDSVSPYLAKIREAEKWQANLGISAKQMTASLRGVPAQFTDIVTSLQGGQRPLSVFLQQGGQLKDMFGGAGNAAKALGGYVLGLLNPLTITAGAVAALAVAYHQGEAESEAFNKSLIMTGNIAGTTAGQLGDIAKTVAGASGATIGAVSETLNEITASGKVSADMLAKVAQAAIDMERSGGAAASDTVKEFAALGDAPVESLIKLNEKYHFLTASVYEQVKALQDQGKETEAARVAQEAYAGMIESRVPSLVENLGLLETAWKGISGTAKGAWDAMVGVGRTSSLNDQLASVTAQIGASKGSAAQASAEGGLIGRWRASSANEDVVMLEKQKRVIQAMIDGEKSVTEQVVAQNKSREAGVAWSRESAKYSDTQAKKQAEILRVTTMMTEAGKSQVEITKVLALIEEKYAEKKGASVRAVKEDFSELFLRAEQMKAIYAALGIELKEIEKQNEDYAKSVAALIDPIEKEASSLERQLETYGLTRSEIESTTIARLEEAQAMALFNGASEDNLAFYEREIEARKRIRAASEGIDAKKASEEWEKESAKAAKKAADDWEKASDKIGDSITDALMRGFESGKSFAVTLRDTVVNMFKTMVLQPIIKGIVTTALSAVGMGGAGNALAGASGIGSSTAGIGGIVSLGKSAWGAYTGGIGTAYGAFAESGVGSAIGLSTAMAPGYMAPVYGAGGTLLSAGTGTAAGGLTSAGSAIGAALPYVGLAVGAIALISSLLGDKAKPSKSAKVVSTLDNGAYTVDSVGKANKTNDYGAQFAAPAESINKQYLATIGPLFTALGNKQAVTISTELLKRDDGKQFSHNDITVGGVKTGMGTTWGKIGDADALAKATNLAMGEGISRAIVQSDLAQPIRALFDQLLDATLVKSMVVGLTKVGNSSKELNDVWGISVEEAAKVAALTSTNQTELAAQVGAIGDFAASQKTQGESAAATYKTLSNTFEALSKSEYPAGLKEYDAAMKAVDTTVAGGIETFAALFSMRGDFAAFTEAINTLRSATQAAVLDIRTPGSQLGHAQQTLSEVAAAAGTPLPKSAAELVALADSIDYTTAAGINLAAAMPGLVTAFKSVQTAVAAGLSSKLSLMAKYSSDEQNLTSSTDTLTSGFAALGLAIPKSSQEFLTLVDSTNHSSAAGRDLIDALTALAPAFDAVRAPAIAAGDALVAKASTISDFRTALVDEIFSAQLDGMATPAQITALKKREEGLWSALNGGDTSVASTLKDTLLKRIALEAKAQTSSLENAKTLLDTMKSAAAFAISMHNEVLSLSAGDLSPLSYLDQLSASATLWSETLAKAQAGDATAQGSLSSTGSAYLKEAQSYYGANADYASVFGSVTGAMDGFSATSPTEIQIENQSAMVTQLKASATNTQATVDELKKLNTALGVQADQVGIQINQNGTVGQTTIEQLKAVRVALAALESQLKLAVLA